MKGAALAGIVLLALAVAGALWLGDLRAHPVADAALLATALAGFALLIRAAVDAAVHGIVFVGLLLVRGLAFVGAAGTLTGPALSDDAYRYVHEGRAQRGGLAVPYAIPPAAITPAPDDGTTARVNHKDVPAAYPPGTELVLFATVAAGDAVGLPMLPLRVLLAAADVAVLLLLRRRRSKGAAWVLYGAHPLPILEVVLGGHLDGIGVALLFGALLVSRDALRGALIGLAAHVKPVAVIGLLSARSVRALVHASAGFAVALLVPAIPYLFAGAPIFRGLLEYGTRWRAAPFFYAALEAPFVPFFAARAARGVYTHLDWGFLPRPILVDAGFCARVVAGALLALLVLAIARSRASPEGKVGAGLLALWLLAPTVHPWYLVWLVPFAAASSSRALLGFTALAPMLYQPVFAFAAGGAWQESAWPRLAMLVALGAGAVLDRRRAR